MAFLPRDPLLKGIWIGLFSLLWGGPIMGIPTCAPLFYSIEMDEAVLGYIKMEAKRTKSGWTFKETGILAVGIMGGRRFATFSSETIATRTFRVKEYKISVSSVGFSMEIACKGEAGRIIRSVESPPAPPRVQSFKAPSGTLIADGNSASHFFLLTKAKASGGDVTIFDPFLGEMTRVRISDGGMRSAKIMEKEHRCRVILVDERMEIWTDPSSRKLLMVLMPSQRIAIKLSEEKVLEKIAISDISSKLFYPSNFQISPGMDRLSVEIKAEYIVGIPRIEDINTRNQSFKGKIEKGWIEGVLEIRLVPYKGESAPKFPIPCEEKYLSPSIFVESDDPEIKAKAMEISSGAVNAWEAALAIGKWVHQNIRYEIAESPSAKAALLTRRGDCGSHATLTVAMMRSIGIPARIVGGLMYTGLYGGSFGQHLWVEAYMGQDGWIPLDPTTGEYGAINVGHIKLFSEVGFAVPKKIRVIAE